MLTYLLLGVIFNSQDCRRLAEIYFMNFRMPKVQLAFAQPQTLPRILTDVDSIPNKVGGLPIWLDYLNPSPPIWCSACSSHSYLLMQLYCPSDDCDRAYHRVIYVFCCPKAGCLSPVTVLRSQLEVVNDCYTADGVRKNCELNGFSLISTTSKEALTGYCTICACFASRVCSNCQFARYCCKEHQKLDWPRHKLLCIENGSGSGFEYGFKEFELISEEEPSKGPTIGILPVSDAEIGDDVLELENETVTGVDQQFLKFQKRISLAPSQVLRYYWVDKDTETEGPLFVAQDKSEIVVPNCDCGATRKFEFQLMPQLLNHIGDKVDWGTILIYTCSVDCASANGKYSIEYSKIQHFSNDGMYPNFRSSSAKNEEE